MATDGSGSPRLRRRTMRRSAVSSRTSTSVSTASSARRSMRLSPDDLLVVMSDHGFASWRRSFNLNSWLSDNGYLAMRDPARPSSTGFFANVDWSQTRAYGLGLNGLYINLNGREAARRRRPGRPRPLVSEIASKLVATTDPRTGAQAVTRVFRREDVYKLGRGRGHRAGSDCRVCQGHAQLRRIGARAAWPADDLRGQHDALERRSLHGSGRRARHSADQPATQDAAPSTLQAASCGPFLPSSGSRNFRASEGN